LQSGFALCILNRCLKTCVCDGLSQIKMKLLGIWPLLHPLPWRGLAHIWFPSKPLWGVSENQQCGPEQLSDSGVPWAG